MLSCGLCWIVYCLSQHLPSIHGGELPGKKPHKMSQLFCILCRPHFFEVLETIFRLPILKPRNLHSNMVVNSQGFPTLLLLHWTWLQEQVWLPAIWDWWLNISPLKDRIHLRFIYPTVNWGVEESIWSSGLPAKFLIFQKLPQLFATTVDRSC